MSNFKKESSLFSLSEKSCKAVVKYLLCHKGQDTIMCEEFQCAGKPDNNDYKKNERKTYCHNKRVRHYYKCL
ncbi:hypothetical protein PR048_025269 [Dryococelus australis]|uniref:Uncharacterized protein n=1 Tax=Dryococelus australis TaxID=614101 RepID=A0ABQ9GQT8_9NEOP|nr:hypothetical protein PR048_025269 [Dryococelus australis]